MPLLTRDETGKLVPTGKTYAKFTICKYDEHVPVNLEAALAELQEAEAKKAQEQGIELQGNWGGRETIFGSPQGESSLLSVEEVVEIVKKHLL